MRRPCLIVIARRFTDEAIQIHNKAMLFDWITTLALAMTLLDNAFKLTPETKRGEPLRFLNLSKNLARVSSFSSQKWWRCRVLPPGLKYLFRTASSTIADCSAIVIILIYL